MGGMENVVFYLTLTGLGVSVIGDALFVIPVLNLAPLGIVFFGFAQVLYSAAFLYPVYWKMSLIQAVLASLPVMALGGLVSAVLYPPLAKIARERSSLRVMLYACGGYFFLVSGMLWTAFVQAVVTPDTRTVLALGGAMLFYVSDMTIAYSAISSFADHWLFQRRVVVMATYYAAQYLIALSLRFL